MIPTPRHPTWCEIDLDAVAHNMATIRGLVGPDVAICVCVKGDANGCGDLEVARTAVASGAACIAFGNMDRAFAARAAGLTGPILLYPSALPADAPALEAAGMMPTLSTLEDVAAWSAHARHLPVFLKLDGGGFRAGALPHDAVAVAQAIAASRTLSLAGVYGHPMTTYGPPDPAYTTSQIESCRRAIAAIEAAGLAPPMRIVSSSGLVLEHPDADMTAIDPGRLVVGVGFPAIPGRERPWRPALIGLRSRLVMVKSLADPGDVMPAPFLPLRPGMRLGLIPFGWSDGYPRDMPARAEALIRGRRVRLLGPPHSELLRVDLTDVPDAAPGDEVVLLGRSGAEEITLAALAGQWGVPESTLPALIGRTVRREYHAPR